MTARVLPLQLEPTVTAADVMAQLGCSRSAAYEHLRAAARREQGARGLLRVRLSVWESYCARNFGGVYALLAPLVPPITCGVYFLQHDVAGPIKIGGAFNIDQRIRLLQTGNPCALTLRGYMPVERSGDMYTVERAHHQRFWYLRLTGEWFRAEPDLLQFIAEHARP